MRALLVANPTATTYDDDVREAVVARLRQRFDHVEVGLTKQRGHALHLVAGAVHDHVDAVFALGGDGTANEVVQRLAETDVAFCHVPGGGTNLIARGLGAPNDPLGAVDRALDALDAPPRRIALGRAEARWFAAIAGYGFDAAIVRRVEQAPALKRFARQLSFVWAGFAEWFEDGAGLPPDQWVAVPGQEAQGPFAITIIGNGDPYTWLGPRPLRITPQATFEGGIDVLAVRQTSTARILRIIGQAFSTTRHVKDPAVGHWHDLDDVLLSSHRPLPLMVDGDYAGDHEQVRFSATRDALRVLA